MRVARYLVLATFAAAAFVGVSASSVSAAGKPRIFFISPKNGASVKSPVHLEFGIENYKIAPVPDGTVTTARPGVGHFHLGIDVGCVKTGETIVKGTPSWVHFGKGDAKFDAQLAPGKRKL